MSGKKLRGLQTSGIYTPQSNADLTIGAYATVREFLRTAEKIKVMHFRGELGDESILTIAFTHDRDFEETQYVLAIAEEDLVEGPCLKISTKQKFE